MRAFMQELTEQLRQQRDLSRADIERAVAGLLAPNVVDAAKADFLMALREKGETAVEIALHHINTPPPSLPEHLVKYQRLLDKLVEKDRDARFRNADEVIGFLYRKFYQGGTTGGTADKTQRLH